MNSEIAIAEPVTQRGRNGGFLSDADAARTLNVMAFCEAELAEGGRESEMAPAVDQKRFDKHASSACTIKRLKRWRVERREGCRCGQEGMAHGLPCIALTGGRHIGQACTVSDRRTQLSRANKMKKATISLPKSSPLQHILAWSKKPDKW